MRVGLLSGALAGIAGVGEVAGLKGYLTADLSPGFGYSGIVVAMLAGLSPIGVVFAALFIASILSEPIPCRAQPVFPTTWRI